jgi:hypothetical protein
LTILAAWSPLALDLGFVRLDADVSAFGIERPKVVRVPWGIAKLFKKYKGLT